MRISSTLILSYVALIQILQIPVANQTLASENSGRKGFLVGLQSGCGSVHLQSNQSLNVSRGTFSLGFQGGYAVTPYLNLGLEVGGWLLESFSFNAHGQEEERGEAISNTMIFIHIFPITRLPLYLRAALGQAHYKNNNWHKTGGDGWGAWLLGGGYELRISDQFYGAAQLSYGRGHFSDVPDILGKEAGRRYEVIDISLALHWYSKR